MIWSTKQIRPKDILDPCGTTNYIIDRNSTNLKMVTYRPIRNVPVHVIVFFRAEVYQNVSLSLIEMDMSNSLLPHAQFVVPRVKNRSTLTPINRIQNV